MHKPYIKKLFHKGKIAVWEVDGEFIRKNIDKEFTNFGHHLRFARIPTNEFWVDSEYVPGELNYFLTHMIIEHRLMKRRVPFSTAHGYALRAERAERRKADPTIKMNSKCPPLALLKKIRKYELKSYHTQDVQVYIVSGEKVRSNCYTDFTEGGHDLVYAFIPRNEIWLDDDIYPRERKFILLHELHERNLMKQDFSYTDAHSSASNIEHDAREHPAKLESAIKKELRLRRKSDT